MTPPNADESVWKSDPSDTTGGNANGRVFWKISLADSLIKKKKLNIQVPYDPATALLGICPIERKA